MRHTVACHLLQLSLPLPLGQFLIDDVLATTKQWDMMEMPLEWTQPIKDQWNHLPRREWREATATWR
jgi:hypothetical protein